jgi:hypothetical protein
MAVRGNGFQNHFCTPRLHSWPNIQLAQPLPCLPRWQAHDWRSVTLHVLLPALVERISVRSKRRRSSVFDRAAGARARTSRIHL